MPREEAAFHRSTGTGRRQRSPMTNTDRKELDFGSFQMRKITLIAASIGLLASSALAQSSFDGTYDGVSRASGGRPRDLAGRAGSHVGPGCPFVSGVPVPLTIRNGVVHSSAWSGTVDSNGAISIQNRNGDRVDGTIAAGTIRGQYQGLGCVVTFVWQQSQH
jgi:hypothetical protein